MQLVGVEPLGATIKLVALKLVDDEAELLDLAVAPVFLDDQIVHQLVQHCRIRRQIREIQAHKRLYTQRDSRAQT